MKMRAAHLAYLNNPSVHSSLMTSHPPRALRKKRRTKKTFKKVKSKNVKTKLEQKERRDKSVTFHILSSLIWPGATLFEDMPEFRYEVSRDPGERQSFL